MDYEALLAEVLALLQQETNEQCCGEHRLSAGRRALPLSISLPIPLAVLQREPKA